MKRPGTTVTAAAVLIALLAAVQITTLLQESMTFDEGVHLTAGYLYWRTGDLRWNSEHPPLSKQLVSLPLLWFDPQIPWNLVNKGTREQWELSTAFLYGNHVSHEVMLTSGRLVAVLETTVLLIAVFWWTRRRFGDAAGLGALALAGFDPNLIAHGRYTNTDIPLTLFTFLAAAAWFSFLESGRWRWCIAAGLALGCALASKFSGVFLLPAFGLMALWRWRDWRRTAAGLLAAFALTWAVISLVYIQEGPRLLPGIRLVKRDMPAMHAEIRGESLVSKALVETGQRLGLGAGTWAFGLNEVAKHNVGGHASYLLGEKRDRGWWYYFPVVFGVKSTLAMLVGVLLLAGALSRSEAARGSYLLLLVPPAVLFAMSMASQINIGIRHILPMYPLLAVVIAVALTRARWHKALVAICVLAAIETASIYPHYLSFFNWAIGGPTNGHKYLVDSNLDWGQDAIRLKRALDEIGADKVCVAWFGVAPLHYYGMNAWPLPRTQDREDVRNIDCVAVGSVTLLHNLYVPKGSYEWIAGQPHARIGYSLWLWDKRKRPSSTAR